MGKTKKLKRIGEVIHFYKKISVCVIKLNDNLAVGDTVQFQRGGENLFEQKVDSMQIEHENIESASKGQEVAIKTKKEAKTGAVVCKVN